VCTFYIYAACCMIVLEGYGRRMGSHMGMHVVDLPTNVHAS
jgi:hypothetical protein